MFQRREGHDVGGRLPHPDDGALARRRSSRARVYNDIISLIDWFPTLLRGGGRARHQGARWPRARSANGKKFKVHLDGYNFLPYFQGEEKTGPRDSIYYFDQGGNLNAIRWNDWK